MFVTDENHKHPMSQLLGGDGVGIWQAVEVELYRPWFVIEFEQPAEECDGARLSRTMLSARVDDILGLSALSAQGGVLLKSVAMVAPYATNPSGNWRMDPLVAIWEADEPSEPGMQAKLFEKADGGFYVDSAFGSPLECFTDMRPLVALPTAFSSTTMH